MSGPYLYNRTPGTHAPPPPPPPPSGSPNKGGPSTPNKSIQQRRRRTCGRCRVEARENCNGASPCQWCTRTGDRCAYGPSPDAPSPSPAPGTAPTSTQAPAWWTPGGTRRKPSDSLMNPLSISSDGSQHHSGNSPAAQGRPRTPRQPSSQSNPGTPSGDPRATGSPVQRPRSSAPNQVSRPSYPQDQAFVRLMDQAPPAGPGGAAYVPQPPTGTSFRGDEEELARAEAEAQSETPHFDEAWEASELSDRVEAAQRERRGEGMW